MQRFDRITVGLALEMSEVLIFPPTVVTTSDQCPFAKQSQDGVLRPPNAFHGEPVCYPVQILARMKRHAVWVTAPPLPFSHDV